MCVVEKVRETIGREGGGGGHSGSLRANVSQLKHDKIKLVPETVYLLFSYLETF